MKILIPLAAGMLLPAMLFAATPTPTPTVTPTPSVTPTPTPVRAEITGFRVPIGSSVVYGSTDPNSQTGVLVRIKVDSLGRVVVAPTP